MIVKDKTSPIPTDKYAQAGYKAEKQMAFYLRRAFGDADDIFVFNDLRLERNGEVAQIDHLVLHRFGFVIVESKSVVSEIAVNSQGEFARIFKGRKTGMHSPIHQAKLQAELLGKLLNDHKEALRRKIFFGTQQCFFGEVRFRVFVAVSDQGYIQRNEINPEELCKAEAVVEKIRAVIDLHGQTRGIGGFVKLLVADRQTARQMEKDSLPEFTEEEMENLRAFLLQRDTSSRSEDFPQIVDAELVKETQNSIEANQVNSTLTRTPDKRVFTAAQCRNCQQSNLVINHGRYGYYFKCIDCNGNTPIDLACSVCNEKTRVTKARNEFSKTCGKCGQTVLFFVNPEA